MFDGLDGFIRHHCLASHCLQFVWSENPKLSIPLGPSLSRKTMERQAAQFSTHNRKPKLCHQARMQELEHVLQTNLVSEP